MSQNITLMGASYSDVPAVTLPKTGGGTASFFDVTDTTAAAADVASGKYFYTAAGVLTPGTASGSGYGYTLLGSKEYAINTTSTSQTSQTNITVAAAWTKAKIIYVRVRDKAGKKAGYFYGSDCWFLNYQLANGGTSSLTAAARLITRYSTSSQFTSYSGSYGVYGYDINSSGRVRIYSRYNSTYSLTINGTYVIQVYALDWPDGKTIFA